MTSSGPEADRPVSGHQLRLAAVLVALRAARMSARLVGALGLGGVHQLAVTGLESVPLVMSPEPCVYPKTATHALDLLIGNSVVPIADAGQHPAG